MSQSPAPAASSPTAAPSPTPRTGSSAGWIPYLVLGLVGGLVGGLLLDRTHKLFPVIEPPEVANTQGIYTPEQRALVVAAQLRADRKNIPLAIALLGACVAGGLGLAHGLSRGGAGGAVTGLVAGLVLGGVLGAAGGFISIFAREQLRNWNTLGETGAPDPIKSQLHTMALHLPSWIGIALAVGLTAAVVTRDSGRVVRTTGQALVAVVLASVLFPTLSSIVFQLDDLSAVIPGGMGSRLLWSALSAALMGLVIGHSAATTAPAK